MDIYPHENHKTFLSSIYPSPFSLLDILQVLILYDPCHQANMYECPSQLLWCNNTTGSFIKPHFLGFCTSIMIAPQVYLYDPKTSLYSWEAMGRETSSFRSSDWAPPKPLERPSSKHTLWSSNSRPGLARLWLPIWTVSNPFNSRSLEGIALQNWRALEVMIGEQGGTCIMLREECCFCFNQSGLVEQDKCSKISGEISGHAMSPAPTPHGTQTFR